MLQTETDEIEIYNQSAIILASKVKSRLLYSLCRQLSRPCSGARVVRVGYVHAKDVVVTLRAIPRLEQVQTWRVSRKPTVIVVTSDPAARVGRSDRLSSTRRHGVQVKAGELVDRAGVVDAFPTVGCNGIQLGSDGDGIRNANVDTRSVTAARFRHVPVAGKLGRIARGLANVDSKKDSASHFVRAIEFDRFEPKEE